MDGCCFLVDRVKGLRGLSLEIDSYRVIVLWLKCNFSENHLEVYILFEFIIDIIINSTCYYYYYYLWDYRS